ncbi:MAG: hypothetical protein SNJ79_01340 [Sphingomonadaceae bacterium]
MNDITLKSTVEIDNSKAVQPLQATKREVERLTAEQQRAEKVVRALSGRYPELAERLQRTGQAGRLTASEFVRLTREQDSAAAAARRQAAEAEKAAVANKRLEAASRAAAAAARQQAATKGRLARELGLLVTSAAGGARALDLVASRGRTAALAIAGLSKTAGGFASFLAGPWGAALFAATTVLGVLATKTREARDAKDDHRDATQRLAQAIDDLNAALGLNVDKADILAAEERRLTREKLASALATREQLKAELELAEQRSRATQQAATGFGLDSGASAFALTELNRIRDAARRNAEEVGALTESILQQISKLVVSETGKAQEASRKAAEAASRAARDGARAAAEAAREAARAEAERVRQYEALVRAANDARAAILRIPQVDLSVRGQRSAADAAAREALESQMDADFVRRASYGGRIAERDAAVDSRMAARDAGLVLAQEATRELIRGARDIGFAIGGRTADRLSRVLELSGAVATGNVGQVGGVVGGVVNVLGNLGSITENLTKTFRGAGQAIKGLFSGGGLSAGGLGAVAGAAGIAIQVGQVLARLLKPSQRGKVTLTGSGGDILQGATGGNNADNRAAAESIAGAFQQTLRNIVEQLGGTIGTFAVTVGRRNDNFTVDTLGRNNTAGPGVLTFKDAQQALEAALADAIRDGAVAGVSAPVQAALRRYANDLNRAVAEALKVQDLEDFVRAAGNPFANAFRDFERQARDRLRIARDYGFEIVEIERLNAEERARLIRQATESTVSAARDLLNDLRFGSLAEGSIADRLRALAGERARLQAAVDGGDLEAINALARIIEDQVELTRKAFGTTAPFAAERTDAIAALEAVIARAEDKIAQASLEAQRETNAKLGELNTTADELLAAQREAARWLEQIASAGGGAGSFVELPFNLYARFV